MNALSGACQEEISRLIHQSTFLIPPKASRVPPRGKKKRGGIKMTGWSPGSPNYRSSTFSASCIGAPQTVGFGIYIFLMIALMIPNLLCRHWGCWDIQLVDDWARRGRRTPVFQPLLYLVCFSLPLFSKTKQKWAFIWLTQVCIIVNSSTWRKHQLVAWMLFP